MDKRLKTHLFGFSKKDTIDYIENYQNECNEKMALLELDISKLTAENEKLRIENAKLSEEKDDVSDNLAKVLLKLDSISSELNEERKKSDENINVKNRVGEIFIDAKQRADSIVDEANKQAKNIRTFATEQAENTVSDINLTYMQLEQLRNNMKSVFNDFCSRVDNINLILKSSKDIIKIDSPNICSEKNKK